MIQENNQLKYHGNVWSICAISIVNLFLKIITLGFYSPWAKTKVRRYLYNNFSIFGSRLEYLGRGGEIFKACAAVYLLVFLTSAVVMILTAIAIVIVLPMLLHSPDVINGRNIFLVTKNAMSAIWVPFLVFFIGYYAAFAGLGYKVSRTTWRGIRGRLEGKAVHYAFFRFKRLFLNIISLGFLIGRTDILARKYKIERMSLGSVKFHFSLKEDALDMINLSTLLLAIPTLFFSRIYYKAAMLRMFWNATSIENVQFKGYHSFGGVLWISVSNILIFLFTLGLGIPIMINRTAKYFARNIEITGDIEESKILQASDLKDARGEPLEDLTSVGLDFDIGLW